MANKALTDLSTLSGVVSSETQILAKSGETVGWTELSEFIELVAENIQGS